MDRRLALGFLVACTPGPPEAGRLVLNEVMAHNTGAWVDPAGTGDCPEHDDWIELHNPGATPIDLAGYRITDDRAAEAVSLPPGTLAPGAHLLLVADDQPEQGGDHLPFKVDRHGETLYLLDERGAVAGQLAVPVLGRDTSWGRTADGAWRLQRTPSPGAPNEATPDDPCFERDAEFDDHTVPCISTPEGFAYLAAARSGLEIVKLDVLDFQTDPHAIFLDTRFYELHDEWYLFRMLNGQEVPGETLYDPWPGSFQTVDALYAWAGAELSTSGLDPDLVRFTTTGRLYSPRYYELALRAPRVLGAGTLIHRVPTQEAGELWAFELEFSDDIHHDELVVYFTALQAALPSEIGDELQWLVRSSDQEELAQRMERNALSFSDRIVRYDELATSAEAEVYGAGDVAGRVHRVFAGEPGIGSTRPTDILVLEEIPDELPLCAALVTAVPQTALAHIALLAESRGIPNVYLPGVMEDPRWDNWDRSRAPIRLTATQPDGVELTQLTESEYAAFAGTTPPTPPVLVPIDPSALPWTVDLLTTPVEDMPALRPEVGGKAAGMLALTHTPSVVTPEAPLALSVRAYHEHMDALGWVDALLDTPEFASYGDVRARYLVLEGTDAFLERYTAPHEQSFPADFVATQPAGSVLVDLVERGGARHAVADAPVEASPWIADVRARFAHLEPSQGLRFRSSSSVEDLEGFNGAGLYGSYTGRITPAEGERTLERAAARVWASYWGAPAFEERHALGLEHRDGGMGVLVHPAFDDEHELSNGVLTATQHTDGSVEVVVNVQVGDLSVTNPTADDCRVVLPEVVRMSWAPGESSPSIERVSASTELAGPVLSDAQLEGLFASAQDVLVLWLSVEPRDALTLDIEFREMAAAWPAGAPVAADRIVLKQARPL